MTIRARTYGAYGQKLGEMVRATASREIAAEGWVGILTAAGKLPIRSDGLHFVAVTFDVRNGRLVVIEEMADRSS